MQTSNKIFDDLARVANGAVSTLVGVKDEIESLVRQRVDRILADADMVSREEFDAVKAMAAEARAEQDRLAKRLSVLEKASSSKRPRTAPRKKAANTKTSQTKPKK